MARVYILGMGPGHPDYILPITRKTAKSSDVLIGSPRLLKLFQDLHKKEVPLKNNYSEVLTLIERERGHQSISILVSGDPSFYSFTERVRSQISDCKVIPGIGSISMAFAQAGLPWQNAIFTSVHGRDKSCLEEGAQNPGKHLAILTDSKHNPQWTADMLLSKNPINRPVWIMSNLGLEEEKIWKSDLTSLSQKTMDYPSLTLIVVEAIKI